MNHLMSDKRPIACAR